MDKKGYYEISRDINKICSNSKRVKLSEKKNDKELSEPNFVDAEIFEECFVNKNDSSSSISSLPLQKPEKSEIENNVLLKNILKEIKFLRHEQKYLRNEVSELKIFLLNNQNSSTSKTTSSLNIPKTTAEAFTEFDEELKNDNKLNILVRVF